MNVKNYDHPRPTADWFVDGHDKPPIIVEIAREHETAYLIYDEHGTPFVLPKEVLHNIYYPEEEPSRADVRAKYGVEDGDG